jgi:oligopeptide/dipeptide ABC transporter ATP-binding protein
MNQNKLLAVKNLSISFDTDEGRFKAVDDVAFEVDKSEIVGLVGESGCGKSVTALGLLRLIPTPAGKIETGEVHFKGRDLLALEPDDMRHVRGSEIGMIFQEPAAALSPLHRVGKQMTEALRLHQEIDQKTAWDIAAKWLEKVSIPDAGQRMQAYPYQLSGGMQQRIMIAMALMLEPALIIADEPTTALDVTIAAQVFDLIKAMREKETAVLLITHDMGVVWEMCDRVMVMYASRISEQGSLETIFNKPAHPYTQGLLQSIPKLTGPRGRLEAIPGFVPSPANYPSGCHFRDRCQHAFERCQKERPGLVDLGDGHLSACFLAEQWA